MSSNESKFMPVLRKSLADVSDIFSYALCEQSQRNGILIVAVDFVPIFDEQSIANGVEDVFNDWYTNDNRNFMVEFTIYDQHVFIRTISPPIGQTTGKRDLKYNFEDGFGKKLRSFLIAARKNWENRADTISKEKKIRWAIDPFGFDADDTDITRSDNHAVLVSSNDRDIRLEAIAKPISGDDENVMLEMKLSFRHIDKARIEKIAALINQM
jgi:hypothetical protein